MPETDGQLSIGTLGDVLLRSFAMEELNFLPFAHDSDKGLLKCAKPSREDEGAILLFVSCKYADAAHNVSLSFVLVLGSLH